MTSKTAAKAFTTLSKFFAAGAVKMTPVAAPAAAATCTNTDCKALVGPNSLWCAHCGTMVP